MWLPSLRGGQAGLRHAQGKLSSQFTPESLQHQCLSQNSVLYLVTFLLIIYVSHLSFILSLFSSASMFESRSNILSLFSSASIFESLYYILSLFSSASMFESLSNILSLFPQHPYGWFCPGGDSHTKNVVILLIIDDFMTFW